MASRKRKRVLPPWLQGVSVKQGVPVKKDSAVGNDKGTDDSTDDHQSKDGFKNATNKLDFVQHKTLTSLQNTAGKTSGTDKIETLVKPSGEGHSGVCDEQKWTAEKVVEMSYDEFCFNGSIIYSHNMDDCNILCDDFMSTITMDTEAIIGFDTEWPVTYQKGKQASTALVQICSSTDKCYLFHVSCMPKFPVMLKKLLEMRNVKKVGMNVENDFWKLDVDFDITAQDIIRNSLIELRTLANTKLRSAENWSLEGLAKNVLHLRINKDQDIRKCDWTQFPLPEIQQRYAATDAVISLMLYRKLTEKKVV